MHPLHLTQLFATFGTGVLASLSPCVYPILPITVGFLTGQAGERRRSRVVWYAVGQSLTFGCLGVVAVLAGETLGFSSESPAVNLAMGTLLVAAAAISALGRVPAFLQRLGPSRAAVGGTMEAFALGAGSALLVSPCTSPILAGVLAMMATASQLWTGVVLMLIYSFGFSFLFLVLGLGLVRLPRSGRWMVWFHRLSAALLTAAGGYYLARGFHWLD
jgi:thiol:disulfide interchange protein DsbD